jgi:hypothetical protein
LREIEDNGVGQQQEGGERAVGALILIAGFRRWLQTTIFDEKSITYVCQV